jgi:2-aminoadipate transaminase
MNVDQLLATRTSHIKASAIRELLKIATNPGMISLGGGLPSPDSFPLDLITELTDKVLKKYGPKALQYDLTEGFIPLRKALIDHCKSNGIDAEMENIYITSGSQGFLDAIGKLLISPGDYVAVEGPTYLAALQAFNAYEARYAKIETDDEGLIPESLEKVITKTKVKFVYTVPTFQNPSGKTIKLKRRQRIAEIIKKHDTLLVEDDPYSALRYSGEPLPTIKSMAPDHVVYVSTFSKIFAPGLRLGYFVSPESFGKWMVIVKQGVDLNTCTFTQALASEYLIGGYLPNQMEKTIKIYKPKLETMYSCLKEYFSSDYKVIKPDGGMFLWIEGPKGLDMEVVSKKSIEKGVGFVPGKFFYPDPNDGIETVRLNFTCVSCDQIKFAMKTIAQACEETLKEIK